MMYTKVIYNFQGDTGLHGGTRTYCGMVLQEGEADLKLNTKCALWLPCVLLEKAFSFNPKTKRDEEC